MLQKPTIKNIQVLMVKDTLFNTIIVLIEMTMISERVDINWSN